MLFGVLLVVGGVLAGAPPAVAAPPTIRGAGAASAVPGQYVVVLKDSAGVRAAGVAARSRALNDQHKGRLRYTYERALHGFSAQMSEAEALRLAADPDVAYVEQDQYMGVADTQDGPPSWGLDRIDQHGLPLDTAYTYDLGDPAGPTVNAYIIDSGIRITHPDFGGRASWGWDFTSNTPVADDCHRHGTHVAGTVGGTQHGVAKNVHLVAVKVLDCNGKGTGDQIAAGVDWVTAHAVKPAVANISIEQACVDGAGNPAPCPAGSGDTINTAITNSINSGISYVIAGGNSNINACGNPYGRVPGAIVVGATTSNDAKASFSNWGSCVDLWAPGDTITSDWFSGDPNKPACTDTCAISGTSMAAPHVAGEVAALLRRPGWATKTPAEIKTELLTNMVTSGVITGLDAGSPNKLLYDAPPPAGAGSSIAAAANDDGSLDLFGVNAAGGLFFRSQAPGSPGSWSGWTVSTKGGWYAVAGQTGGDGRITVSALQRAGMDVWHRDQALKNCACWLGWSSFPGALSSLAFARSGNGTLQVFGTNSQGQPWQGWQTGVGSPNYATWTSFGTGMVLRAIAADTNANGLIEVFAVDKAGVIWHRWQTAVNATSYTPWVQFADGRLVTVATARSSNGRLVLFGANSQGQVFFRDAADGTNNWFSWNQLTVPAAVGALRSVTAERNADGLIEVFAVNQAGQIWHTRQSAVNSDVYLAWDHTLDGTLRP